MLLLWSEARSSQFFYCSGKIFLHLHPFRGRLGGSPSYNHPVSGEALGGIQL